MTINEYADALREAISVKSKRKFEFDDYDCGFVAATKRALELLEDVISNDECTAPSKKRLLALADKMLVLGSPQSSKELLDMAEKFGV